MDLFMLFYREMYKKSGDFVPSLSFHVGGSVKFCLELSGWVREMKKKGKLLKRINDDAYGLVRVCGLR